MKRENAAVSHVDSLDDVGNELQLVVVAHEARITVDHHHANVAILRHQRPQLAAVAADRPVGAVDVDYKRGPREPLRERRQLAGFDVRLERGRLFSGGRSGAEQDGEPEEKEVWNSNHAESLSSRPPDCMRTLWPSPTSTSSPAPCVVHPYGARHSCGLRAAPSSTAARLSLRWRSA